MLAHGTSPAEAAALRAAGADVRTIGGERRAPGRGAAAHRVTRQPPPVTRAAPSDSR